MSHSRLEQAFRKVDRVFFVPPESRAKAGLDQALSIGFGQTISQPSTVAFMLDRLAVEPGQKVLDVGYGSGWTTALLAELVGPSGHVYAMEIVPELCRLGEQNLAVFPELAERITLFCQSASPGLPEVARKVGGFDKILASAAVEEAPLAWREQLKVGGKVLYPSALSLIVETKLDAGKFDREQYPGFIFVPFSGSKFDT